MQYETEDNKKLKCVHLIQFTSSTYYVPSPERIPTYANLYGMQSFYSKEFYCQVEEKARNLVQ